MAEILEEAFRCTVTDLGRKEILLAIKNKDKVVWDRIVVGSGNLDTVPDKKLMRELLDQRWEGEITSAEIGVVDTNVVTLHCIVPNTVGGFNVREVGIVNDKDELVVIASTDLGYKDTGEESGGFEEIDLYFDVKVDNASVIEVVTSNSTIFATVDDIRRVEDKVNQVQDNIRDVYDPQLKQLGEDLKELEKNIGGDLKTQLEELRKEFQNDDSGLRVYISNVETDLEALKKRVTVIESSYVTKRSGYDLVSTTNVNQITTNKNNITNLTTRVANIESQLSGLASLLESIA